MIVLLRAKRERCSTQSGGAEFIHTQSADSTNSPTKFNGMIQQSDSHTICVDLL